MIVLKHPIAANIILMSTTDAENFSLIGNQSPTEFWNQEVIVEQDLVTCALVDIVEVDVFRAPLEVVHVLAGAVTLLKDEGVV
jgi:hypothetical protein